MNRPSPAAWAAGCGAAVAGALLPATAALAHPGHEGHEALGGWAGLVHPLTGLDHVLAMIAVGLWAALRGGRAMWLWPAAFVAGLLGGFVAGQFGPPVPLAEPAILASIIALGALTAADARMPAALGIALIGGFGAVHGYAHGQEAPHADTAFPLGMALATAALHAAGLAAAVGLQKLRQPLLVRAMGAGALVGGLALAVAG